MYISDLKRFEVIRPRFLVKLNSSGNKFRAEGLYQFIILTIYYVIVAIMG
jgi:hypothetical protein